MFQIVFFRQEKVEQQSQIFRSTIPRTYLEYFFLDKVRRSSFLFGQLKWTSPLQVNFGA